MKANILYNKIISLQSEIYEFQEEQEEKGIPNYITEIIGTCAFNLDEPITNMLDVFNQIEKIKIK
jgi:hypothetical protein